MADLRRLDAAAAPDCPTISSPLTFRLFFAYYSTHRRSEKEGPAVIGYEQAFQPRTRFSSHSSKNELSPAQFFKAGPPPRTQAPIRSILKPDSRESSRFHRIRFS